MNGICNHKSWIYAYRYIVDGNLVINPSSNPKKRPEDINDGHLRCKCQISDWVLWFWADPVWEIPDIASFKNRIAPGLALGYLDIMSSKTIKNFNRVFVALEKGSLLYSILYYLSHIYSFELEYTYFNGGNGKFCEQGGRAGVYIVHFNHFPPPSPRNHLFPTT